MASWDVHDASVNHINLVVSDIQRSIDFYVGKIGFRYVRHLNRVKAVLEHNNFDFFLEQSAGVIPHERFHFGLKTTRDGVYEFAARLRQAGVPLVVGNNPNRLADIYVTPDGVRHVFYFEDPDRYVIEVYSHIGLT
jgi:catechol 2,3-dioxygenase-like lactoylglutathione lyase family enzyme